MPRSASIKAILFDLDGTFAGTATGLVAALKHMRNLCPLTDEEIALVEGCA